VIIFGNDFSSLSKCFNNRLTGNYHFGWKHCFCLIVAKIPISMENLKETVSISIWNSSLAQLEIRWLFQLKQLVCLEKERKKENRFKWSNFGREIAIPLRSVMIRWSWQSGKRFFDSWFRSFAKRWWLN
jgi:hypothetical protein